MANEVEIRVTADTKKAEQQLKGLRGSLNKFSQNAKVGGAALSGFGAVGVVAFKKLISSSKEQEIGINKLDTALGNVGQSYDDNKSAIERVIDATQRKTNFGDEAQREALRTLITIGGQYEGSLDALKVATDLAAGANMSLEGASLLLGKALAGEVSSLSRYGIKLDANATKTEVLAALTKQFGGSAEAAADPMTQLGNRMGDVGQIIGDVFMPFVDKAAVFLEKLATKLTELNPNVVKIGAVVIGATVALAAIGGPILLLIGFLPMLSAGFATLSVAMGPITVVVLALAAAVAAVVLVWKNWDRITNAFTVTLNTIKATFDTVFNAIKGVVTTVFTTITDLYKSKLGWLLPGGAIIKAIFFIKDNWRTIWEDIQTTFQIVTNKIMDKVFAFKDAFTGAFRGIKSIILVIWEGIISGVKAYINMLIGGVNTIIRAVNSIKVPSIKIPGIGTFGGFSANIPEVQSMARGGIVTRPTLAMIGEAGPEAVVPLGGGRGMAPVYNITISGNTVFGEMDFQRLVVDAVTDSHRRGGLPFLGRA
tara:strand:+ start:286 stop:1899 length:1614 start_codon:yes stop_codon:yes gene_type:complete